MKDVWPLHQDVAKKRAIVQAALIIQKKNAITGTKLEALCKTEAASSAYLWWLNFWR